MGKIIYPQLSYEVQGIIYDVYNKLGPVWSEEIYEKAMILGLKKKNFKSEAQKQFEVHYKEQIVGLCRPDIIVENKIILELKFIPEILPVHRAQVVSYLKATGYQLGILINFGDSSPYYKRFPNLLDPNAKFKPRDIELPSDIIYSELTQQILEALLEVHFILGPGFFHYIYRRAAWREFRLRDIPFLLVKNMVANYLNQDLGEREIKLFIVDNKILVLVAAIKEITELDEKKLKSYLKYFKLKLGLIVNFNSQPLTWKFIKNNSFRS